MLAYVRTSRRRNGTGGRSTPERSGADRATSCCASATCPASPSRPSCRSSGGRGAAPIELLGRVPFPRIGELPYFVTLAPYGFYWFELVDPPDAGTRHDGGRRMSPTGP